MHEELISTFLNKLTGYNDEEMAKIKLAAQFSNEKHINQKRKSGEPYIIHPLAVAETLALRLNMDADTICAGLLHDVIEDTDTTEETIEQMFGKNVCELVQGVTKIAAIRNLSKSAAEAETIRKMFIAMSKNMPVIIIKLADKLHNMSTLQYMEPGRAKEIASACLDIYAPLADRLGISWMKAELEDLSLKTLKPDTYKYIQDYLKAKKGDYINYLDLVKQKISKACEEAGIHNVKILSREKHLYSIYMKMKKRRKELEEIFDIFGVRVICNSVTECYTLVGVIHQLWPPMEGRFKDYIAMPKANNYQSLHTTIMGLNGVILEVQIRTYEMDKIAEFGVASHWVYKAESGSGASSQSWVNMDSQQLSRIATKLKSWNTEIEQSESFMDEIKGELLKDTIYVFTPKGQAIELPIGSTALDFAYSIHTEIGNHTVSAKANGTIIPLGQPLKNTQVIEILTQKNARPRVTWLKYAQTTSARRKIRSWLNKYDENLLIDKNIIAKKKEVEAVNAAASASPEPQQPALPQDIPNENIVRQVLSQTTNTVTVSKQKNLMIHIAQCCNPAPGDKIIGYVSRGRGVIVHRADCPNLAHMPEIELRKIDVEWENSETITRKFIVTSKRTQDLFSEIEAAIRNQHGHLVSGSLVDDEMGNLIGTFCMECDQEESFKKVIKSIRSVPNVIKISPAPMG
ncbi:MAG: bifunctional (p)ppGpp synthetase/guanosine-3',5'-bis(diphosphate) 3'-pyrophosphohydrolase [Sphaerochaetaceae bacterium]|nr:bifunctional (p)ppGpp synthetase/guanosine-3',5'-bis(diphosphate) 3'-pyrophosphohydrolase [Sphaerochaetaceae bacterium]